MEFTQQNFQQLLENQQLFTNALESFLPKPYRQFSCKFRQMQGNIPFVNKLIKNDFGEDANIIFDRADTGNELPMPGQYVLYDNSTGVFYEPDTVIILGGCSNIASNGGDMEGVTVTARMNEARQVVIESRLNGVLTDDLINDQYIEVRVYPS